MEKIKNFIQNKPEAACLITLAIFCLLFLFVGLNSYPLVDVDETRYAVMSRGLIGSGDWSILLLNGVPFTEKPPLYFWMTAFSIKYLGFNEFAVRFPTAREGDNLQKVRDVQCVDIIINCIFPYVVPCGNSGYDVYCIFDSRNILRNFDKFF